MERVRIKKGRRPRRQRNEGTPAPGDLPERVTRSRNAGGQLLREQQLLAQVDEELTGSIAAHKERDQAREAIGVEGR